MRARSLTPIGRRSRRPYQSGPGPEVPSTGVKTVNRIASLGLRLAVVAAFVLALAAPFRW